MRSDGGNGAAGVSARPQRGDPTIATRPAPVCYLCGSAGEPLYEGLRDRLFSAPGAWDVRRCENTGCGMLWLDPKPCEQDLGKLYEQYYTHADPVHNTLARRLFGHIRDSYLRREFGYKSIDASPLDEILSWTLDLYPPKRSDFDFPLRYLPRNRKGRLLDLGCGAGTTVALARDCGWQAEGVDVDAGAVANARKKGLTATAGALESLQYPADSFDALIMNHVIEHVHDPRRVLSECLRVLKPGGHLLINTPNTESFGHRRFGRDWIAIDSPRHLHLFAARTLQALVVACGFASISIVAATGRAAGVLSASKAIRATGRFDMNDTPVLYGRMAELMEWVIGLVKKTAGEELRLVARKPSAA